MQEMDIKSIMRKAEKGEDLTALEKDALSQAAAGGEVEMFAKTMVRLAEVLGCSRRSIQKWRKEYPDAPKPRANSTHDIREWREFMERNALKGMGGDDEGAQEELSERELKARKLMVEIEIKEEKLAVDRGENIPRDRVVEFFGAKVAEVTSLLQTKLCGELPQKAAGRDVIEIKMIAQGIVDEIVEGLHRGEA